MSCVAINGDECGGREEESRVERNGDGRAIVIERHKNRERERKREREGYLESLGPLAFDWLEVVRVCFPFLPPERALSDPFEAELGKTTTA